ncbi:MAG: FIST signal transduction protein [Planctomycetota bacterium]|jgi:small ligand-binding sensory domain FIST
MTTDSAIASAQSAELASEDAERALVESLEDGLAGSSADLLVVFATHHHGARLNGLTDRLAERFGAAAAIGCTGETVIGPSREAEGLPGLAAFAARLPGAKVREFTVEPTRDAVGEADVAMELPVDAVDRSSAIVLGEPFSLPIEPFLETVERRWSGVPFVGGLASGGTGPGQNLLLTREGIRFDGAVGIAIEGDWAVEPVVSQGCRPVGEPWVITECEGNVIESLGGRPALAALVEGIEDLSESDRQLVQRAPFFGIAVDPCKSTFERGDFLVRGLLGVDQETNSIAIADYVRRGQTVQLLVRDAESAGEDLGRLLDDHVRRHEHKPEGALLFTCNGRGSRMFGERDHDLRLLKRHLGSDLAVAGFFASGELGPIAGRNFLHGFTASIGLLTRRS